MVGQVTRKKQSVIYKQESFVRSEEPTNYGYVWIDAAPEQPYTEEKMNTGHELGRGGGYSGTRVPPTTDMMNPQYWREQIRVFVAPGDDSQTNYRLVLLLPTRPP